VGMGLWGQFQSGKDGPETMQPFSRLPKALPKRQVRTKQITYNAEKRGGARRDRTADLVNAIFETGLSADEGRAMSFEDST
jgi:hypothetical protein